MAGPVRGTKGMSSTEGRTSNRTHPGADSRASARAGGAGSRKLGPKKSQLLGKRFKGKSPKKF